MNNVHKRRTCCCCFSVTFGVCSIGIVTFLGTLQALINIRVDFGWIDFLFRVSMMPFFFICCWKREQLNFRKCFAITFGVMSLAEVIIKSGQWYYQYNYTDLV